MKASHCQLELIDTWEYCRVIRGVAESSFSLSTAHTSVEISYSVKAAKLWMSYETFYLWLKKNFICDQVRNRGSFSKSHLRHSSLNPDNCSCSGTTKTESAFLNLPNQNQTICKIPSEKVKLQLVAFSLVMISFTLSLRFLHALN